MIKRSSFITLVTLAFIFLYSGNVLSETTIKAKNLQYDSKTKVYHLSGSVEIKKQLQIVRANRIDFFEDTGEVKAYGNVYYEDSQIIIKAEKALININEKKGTIYNAKITFKKDNYRISASEVNRISEKEYIIYNASTTTCDTPLPAWCIDAKKAELRIGDSLKAKGVKFKVKGMTTFYTPYLWAPVNTKRKSGLLFPTIGFNSENGLLWRQPLYLVLSDNRDVTFYLDVQGKKGVGKALEYRYIERNFGRGNWWVYHIKDRELNKDFYELKSEHYRFTSKGFGGFLKINLINQKDFYREYSHRVNAWSSRFLQSTAELSYTNSSLRFYINGKFWQELRKNYQTGTIHQKLPEAGIYVKPKKFGSFYLTIAGSLTNYYSEDLSIIERFDIYPRLRYSTGNTFVLSQTFGVRDTAYLISHSKDYPDSINRASFDYSASLKTTLIKHYGSFRHILEPGLTYNFMPDINQDPPLLDSTELYNRISLFSLILQNYLYRQDSLLLSFKITQPYDFHNGDRAFLPLIMQLKVFEPVDVLAELQYDANYSVIKRANYELGLKIIKATIRIGQRYSKEHDILFYTASTIIPLSQKLSLGASLWYDAKGEGLKNHSVTLSYNAQCWGVTITYNKRPGDYSIFLLIRLKGLGEMKLSSFI